MGEHYDYWGGAEVDAPEPDHTPRRPSDAAPAQTAVPESPGDPEAVGEAQRGAEGRCTTHYACDCLSGELTRLREFTQLVRDELGEMGLRTIGTGMIDFRPLDISAIEDALAALDGGA